MTRRGLFVLIGAFVALVLVVAGVFYAIREGVGPLADPDVCTAATSEHSVSLTPEQAENASIIAAVAERRRMPARALTIAIATAYQESKIENLSGGDRDSLGLFQQRPSQGWGSREQIQDPYYASNAFYDALEKVEGYADLEVTEAAQAVQRSAYPDAYADHEQDARTVASALSGNSEGAFSCVVDGSAASEQTMGDNGLTRRADSVRRDLDTAFGELALGGFEPGGVTAGHMEGSAHYEGRAIDIFFRPVNADQQRRGWAVAHYLVANAGRLDIEHVIFDDRIWTAGNFSDDGWRQYDPPGLGSDDSAERRAILEHRDHVHVDVA
ncbi:MAG: hypothetical protein H0V02_06380 [Nocardioidaceae bacterium]|nr:hypothetical protein [Nocardioidaceae bacterium]